ncbi:DUF6907 domain-containing protein [Streptomyces fulvorobeus]|uniref:Uncharacterized protein n=1 Tax=Streptomyces fulvorobeus TaxID=284028 RepID=A0A7J0C2C6_9ACTN|nr:hypothetical protein [Streptomyces fulvorobeus]NYE40409.1 hypothetical protein [Streptomyces fulvorobeus]GFM96689.1 hypothetical protein Sfulv_15000 [Streptomyces fulvorobeus]
MTTLRTVTVHTLDRGDVTIPEPAWCTGHDGKVPQLLCDTGHLGTAHRAEFGGDELAYAALVQDPFVEHSDRSVGALVEMGHLARALTPAELDGLAAVLVDYAGTLRRLARQLSALKAGESR